MGRAATLSVPLCQGYFYAISITRIDLDGIPFNGHLMVSRIKLKWDIWSKLIGYDFTQILIMQLKFNRTIVLIAFADYGDFCIFERLKKHIVVVNSNDSAPRGIDDMIAGSPFAKGAQRALAFVLGELSRFRRNWEIVVNESDYFIIR